MTLPQRIEQARGQTEAAIRLLDQAYEVHDRIIYLEDALSRTERPYYMKFFEAELKRKRAHLTNNLAAFDSLIATMSQETLVGTLPGVRVYQMTEEKQNIV